MHLPRSERQPGVKDGDALRRQRASFGVIQRICSSRLAFGGQLELTACNQNARRSSRPYNARVCSRQYVSMSYLFFQLIRRTAALALELLFGLPALCTCYGSQPGQSTRTTRKREFVVGTELNAVEQVKAGHESSTGTPS
jgi:hypothetical protein